MSDLLFDFSLVFEILCLGIHINNTDMPVYLNFFVQGQL